jgi:hypothetical protein
MRAVGCCVICSSMSLCFHSVRKILAIPLALQVECVATVVVEFDNTCKTSRLADDSVCTAGRPAVTGPTCLETYLRIVCAHTGQVRCSDANWLPLSVLITMFINPPNLKPESILLHCDIIHVDKWCTALTCRGLLAQAGARPADEACSSSGDPIKRRRKLGAERAVHSLQMRKRAA